MISGNTKYNAIIIFRDQQTQNYYSIFNLFSITYICNSVITSCQTFFRPKTFGTDMQQPAKKRGNAG